ncbi:aldehyde dehydrogenase family protein [Cryptosporangium aurantiacum]|uniref:Aldehyde dehydrogenase (NAD+) n=1 Tax=Cryptosporangium aurantiacum TaxID=134849 RepID=A0A1M7PJY3_9ACTN|nr:aldehyde dehydrogenase family protein [Cryptosporangium aurantiacum]SHN17433.1 aldehyde dehydrogenase (NAD+) [Cryptosporangium aurantiacum]
MTTSIDRTPPAVTLRIGGEKLTSGSGGTHGHVNPATGQVDADIPLAGASEVDQAVQTAHAAFDGWRKTPPAERRRLLMRLADLLDENAAEFARRGTLDNGTPISVSGGFVPLSAEWTRYYAGWADKTSGDLTASFGNGGELGYTLPQPYGVIGIIITWNGPLISLAMKVPAALAAGNTVVVKPSELTPFSGELFADLVEQAGFPAGVVNLLPGAPEAGAALVEHPLVQKVTFTGGPATARKILHACAEQMKPVVLELGGKSANLVFEDADLTAACQHATFMSLGTLSGQGCALPTRMLVARAVYDQVVATVAEVAKNIPIGDPFDPTIISGPVVNEAALERILGMIERAKLDGARLVTGGARLEGPLADGYYLEPTVFADVDPQSELAQTEVFGPVLAITPFDTEEEAVAIANATPYGLSAYVQTNDLKRAHRLAEELEAGEVLVNGAANLAVHRPFGGVGISGVGKEGGRAGIEEFLRTKAVGIA